MGFRCTLFYFDNARKEDVLPVLGLVETAEEDEANDSLFSGATTENAGYVFWQNWRDGMLMPSEYERIAQRHRFVVCNVSETTMFCATAFYENGEFVWSVIHNSDEGTDNLSTDGALPPHILEKVEELRREAASEQAGVTDVDYYFEVPVELFHQISGIRHDVVSSLKFYALKAAYEHGQPREGHWDENNA